MMMEFPAMHEPERRGGEDRRNPGPDVLRVLWPQDEEGLVEVQSTEGDGDVLQEGDPHQSEEHVGHVPAEVAQEPTGAGVQRQPVGESPGPTVVLDALVESAVEHPARSSQLSRPGQSCASGEPMFGAEGPAAVVTLVRHVLVLAAHVATRH